MENNKLESFYRSWYPRLDSSDHNRPYCFMRGELPVADMQSNEILMHKRQLFRPGATQDNLIINMPKRSTRALGLFVMGVALAESDNTSATVYINDPDSDIEAISVIYSRDYLSEPLVPGLYTQPEKYIYVPMLPDEFNRKLLHEREQLLGTQHHVDVFLTNESGEFMEDFNNKNHLLITGTLGGMTLFGEYLLNLSLASAETNYLNFEQNPEDDCDIVVSEDSCTGRIEINDVEEMVQGNDNDSADTNVLFLKNYATQRRAQ